MQKGDIVLVKFPFTDLAGAKLRPALILSSTDADAILIFITTQLQWKERFDIVLKCTPKNGLKKESLLRVNKIATVDKKLIVGKIGSAEEIIKTLNANLIELFNLK
ncbi:MAG: type II toxin-antitoxin system PemK/MazF family toxin [Bacteroidetes bacterium]|nr:type II toxin-antitoxin system PemK/MazF family toxin [Bacteroidota bacterium]